MGAITSNVPSITAVKGSVTVVYSYDGTTLNYVSTPCSFSSDWTAQMNLRTFNNGTSPIIQLISENIIVKWSTSTKKISITRGAMYYSNLYASSCSSGSNSSTTMKIYQVVIVNLTN